MLEFIEAMKSSNAELIKTMKESNKRMELLTILIVIETSYLIFLSIAAYLATSSQIGVANVAVAALEWALVLTMIIIVIFLLGVHLISWRR